MLLDQPTDRFQPILEDLETQGWSHRPGFLSLEETTFLASEAYTRWESGDFDAAAVGRGTERRLRPEIRSDHIAWLEDNDPSPAISDYLQWLHQLRGALNQNFFLGLRRYEGHLALYPAGSFYKRHVDNFQQTSHRIVTCLLYLNQDWQEDHDGGQLRLYTQGESLTDYIDIPPKGGTLLLFTADRFYHEVLPAHQPRLSITGWLCRE